jgi:hypothetical protein
LNNEALNVVNNAGIDISLSTFRGDADWIASHDQERLNNNIWNHPRSLVHPFLLQFPKISNAHADAIIEGNSDALGKLAFEASWATITVKIFKQPPAVTQSIHQSSQVNGVTVKFSIEEFFDSTQRMTGFFNKSEDIPWPIDLTQHFITHCNEDI